MQEALMAMIIMTKEITLRTQFHSNLMLTT